MNIRALTLERVESLRQKLMTKKTELETLTKTTLEQLWELDLVKFEESLKDFEEILEKDREEEEAARLKQQGKKTKKKSKKKKKKKRKRRFQQQMLRSYR